MNLKTEITKIHYKRENLTFREKLIFLFLKFGAVFYSLGSELKNFLYDKKFLKPKKVDAYVISVGNLTTGGVGKTPVVAELARYFVEKGERVAIVSRGYGGKLNNKNVNVISDGINLYYKADMAGDEPYWLAVNLNMCAVLTCSNRYKACKYAVKELGVTRIILDDGFQHRKMYRDLDIVLVDSEKQFGNGSELPAGPLREGLRNLKRADRLLVVSKNVNHTGAEAFKSELQKLAPSAKTMLAKVEPDYVYNIVNGEHLENGVEVNALSAIGQPEQFYEFVEKDFKIKQRITFDDHHRYVKEDLATINGIIITTEKDAVKLSLLQRGDIYAMKLKTTVDIDNLL